MQKLIFIYKANSGIGNALLDSIHKTFSPSTYACTLCDITYHSLGKRKKWAKYLNQLNVETEFTYQNLFKKDVGFKLELPVILSYYKEEYSIFMSNAEMKELNGIDEFISLFDQKLGN